MVKIHVMSDLHIDLRNDLHNINELVGPLHYTQDKILVLAGDVGNPVGKKYWDFLESCCDKYAHVIFIAGNHEYYNSIVTETEINTLIDTKEKPTNLHFLHKNKIIIDGVVFLGTTLWTKINRKYENIITTSMNDFYNIMINTSTNKKKPLTVDDWDALHKDQLNWLKQSIESETLDKIIVITHHLPLQRLSHEKYAKYEKYSSAFFTDLSSSGVFNAKVKFWFCGHTHTKMQYTDPTTQTQFHVNPMGYTGENDKFEVLEVEI